MAHDSRAEISDRAQRLLTLSDELKELSYLVQQHPASGLQLPDDLLKRNQELIEQCDRLASEMLLLRSIQKTLRWGEGDCYNFCPLQRGKLREKHTGCFYTDESGGLWEKGRRCRVSAEQLDSR